MHLGRAFSKKTSRTEEDADGQKPGRWTKLKVGLHRGKGDSHQGSVSVACGEGHPKLLGKAASRLMRALRLLQSQELSRKKDSSLQPKATGHKSGNTSALALPQHPSVKAWDVPPPSMHERPSKAERRGSASSGPRQPEVPSVPSGPVRESETGAEAPVPSQEPSKGLLGRDPSSEAACQSGSEEGDGPQTWGGLCPLLGRIHSLSLLALFLLFLALELSPVALMAGQPRATLSMQIRLISGLGFVAYCLLPKRRGPPDYPEQRASAQRVPAQERTGFSSRNAFKLPPSIEGLFPTKDVPVPTLGAVVKQQVNSLSSSRGHFSVRRLCSKTHIRKARSIGTSSPAGSFKEKLLCP